MPNELKNALNINAPETQSTSDLKKKIGQSTVTFSLWTISGIVLAACSGGTRYIDTGTGDGVDGGSAGLPPVAEGSVVRVYDGAVKARLSILTQMVMAPYPKRRERHSATVRGVRSMSQMKMVRSPSLSNSKIAICCGC